MQNSGINTLVVPAHHPRKHLGDLESLQGSIKRDGLQEPLMVHQIGENQYAVIDGGRRLKAVQEFGWNKVPCFIKKELKPADAAHLSYVKNTERNSLNPIEIALHLKAMQEEFRYTLSELGLKGYGSSASIRNKMKLLELPDLIQKQIQAGELSSAHGLELIKLPSSKEQKRMAKKITDHDLTAKRAGNQIDRYLAKGKEKGKEPTKSFPDTDIPGVYFKDSRDMKGELPKKSVHLIVSSPPYNVGMEYEKGVSFNEHLEMVKDVLKECARVLVPGGIMALNVDDIKNFKGNKGNSDQAQIQFMGHKYQSFLKRHQVDLTDIVIWKKSTAWSKKLHISYNEDTVHTSYKTFDDFEPVYIFRKKGEREVPPEDRVLQSRLTQEQWVAWISGVWDIKSVKNMDGHPNIYPDHLVYRLIKMFSYVGDTVLDPWLGSGTTVKVARELNREGIGYEKELQYKPVIMEKLGLLPEKAADESLETTMASVRETLEPSIETIPAGSEATVTDIESAEEHFEASMPL